MCCVNTAQCKVWYYMYYVLYALKVIGDKIEQNRKTEEKKTEEDTKETSEEEDEEGDEYRWFAQFNFDRKNSLCHVVTVQKKAVSSWAAELEKKYGTPDDLGIHGLKFKIKDYKVGDESRGLDQYCTITVTLHRTTSKLHIQSSKQFFNDVFILKELSKVYRDVHKNVYESTKPGLAYPEEERKSQGGGKKQSKPRNEKRPSPYERNCKICKVCGKEFSSTRLLNQHKTSEHTNKQLEDIDEEDKEENDVVSEKVSPAERQATIENTDELEPEPEYTETEKETNNREKELERELKSCQEELLSCKDEIKKLKTAKRNLEAENTKIKKELQNSFQRVDAAVKEREKIREENKLLTQNRESDEILEVIEDLERDTGEELARQKESGYRRENPASQSQPAGKDKNGICSVCKFEAKSARQLKAHMTAHPDKCDFCGVVFATGGLLRRHISIHHTKTIPKTKCEECNYIAVSTAQMKKHREIHIEQTNTVDEQEVCQFWIRNACRYGNQCRFEHPVLCKFQENCKFLTNCNFFHAEVKQNTEQIQCWYADRCSRSDCKYSHQQSCKFQERCNRMNCRFSHFLSIRRAQMGSGRPGAQENPQLKRQETINMWRPWNL